MQSSSHRLWSDIMEDEEILQNDLRPPPSSSSLCHCKPLSPSSLPSFRHSSRQSSSSSSSSPPSSQFYHSDYFHSASRLSADEQKACGCVLERAVRNPRWCNRDINKMSKLHPTQCKNPWKQCLRKKSVAPSCLPNFDLTKLSTEQLHALNDMKRLPTSVDRDVIILQLFGYLSEDEIDTVIPEDYLRRIYHVFNETSSSSIDNAGMKNVLKTSLIQPDKMKRSQRRNKTNIRLTE